jgi:hypothetical protein
VAIEDLGIEMIVACTFGLLKNEVGGSLWGVDVS